MSSKPRNSDLYCYPSVTYTMAVERKKHPTEPVKTPEELSHEKLLKEYQELSGAMERMKGVFRRSREQTHMQAAGRMEAEQKALIDPLTGLYNKRFLLGGEGVDGELYKAVSLAWREHRPVSLAVIDIDHFKQVNDNLGHDIGDEALKKVADIIRKTVRSSDFEVRFGGEEFVVVLPNTDTGGAKAFGEKLRKTVDEEDFRFKGTDVDANQPGNRLTVSVGVASYPPYQKIYGIGAHSKRDFEAYKLGVAEDLFKDADNALYQSKKKGRNRVSVAGNHNAEVARVSGMLATEMGLSKEDVKTIREAAVLHDVGKLLIPWSILHKQGKLTEEEYEEMMKHPVRGAKLLEAQERVDQKPKVINTDPDKVIPYVKHHHERWDGSGYPDGIKGEDIPLGARIIAVADAYEAMTSYDSERSYNGDKRVDRALKELRLGSGNQFDPTVVNAFMRLAENGRIKSP